MRVRTVANAAMFALFAGYAAAYTRGSYLQPIFIAILVISTLIAVVGIISILGRR